MRIMVSGVDFFMIMQMEAIRIARGKMAIVAILIHVDTCLLFICRHMVVVVVQTMILVRDYCYLVCLFVLVVALWVGTH